MRNKTSRLLRGSQMAEALSKVEPALKKAGLKLRRPAPRPKLPVVEIKNPKPWVAAPKVSRDHCATDAAMKVVLDLICTDNWK